MASEKIIMHPSSEMLLNQAMGNTSEAESLIILGHAAYCPACKAELEKYENLGGNYLNNNDTTDISVGLLEKTLDKIDKTDQVVEDKNFTDHKIRSNLTEEKIRIPSFFTQYLDRKVDTILWNSTINNVRYTNLTFSDKNITGKFLEIPPGKSMPKHGHEGEEATLVLHGGYSDERGHYHKGDLVIAKDSEVHSPVASKDTGCLCLVIYSGSIRFKGLLGSILNLSKF